MYNSKIAEIFEEIADMLELKPDISRFEVLAYRRGAETVESLSQPIENIYRKEGIEGLLELPGIGKTMAASIKEYLETGKIKKYEELKKQFPVDFNTLTKIQGLGAKRVFVLYKKLKVKDVKSLKEAVEKHKIRELEGFGERSESEIAKGLLQFESGGGRMLLGTALPEAESIMEKIRDSGLASRVEIGGSTRRMKETVGDLDILIISDKASKAMDFVGKMDEVESVVLRGPTKTTVRLKIGLNCDFRVVEKESFPAAMQYFTGNKEHNVKMRQIAIDKGLKLNEYGLLDKKGKNHSGPTEESLYKELGLDWMPPEMREDRGEIDLARAHKLPKLITIDDIKGDLHTHTKASDGADTIIDMANAAKRLGLKYIGITDHTQSERIAGGMDDKKFEKHLSEIEKANNKVDGIRILKSAEIDILKDGSLDLKDRTLEMMDYRIASIHTSLNMPNKEMTKRVIAAFETGYVDIWAHPTDRLINERRAIDVDLDEVFAAAKKNNVVMEVDGSPERLDLNDENIIKARRHGLKFSIDTDSHSTDHLTLMRFGIGTARRGWLTKEDVVNTLDADKLLQILKK